MAPKKPERFPLVKRHPLTRWRFDRDMTLGELARALTPSSTQAYLSEIESGKTVPSMSFAQRLCELTGLKLDDFVGR